MNHLVNSLKFYARCNNEAIAFDIRQKFGVKLQEDVPKIINEIMSGYADNEDVIIIDKIEIELTSSDLNNLLADFDDKFRSAFENEIERLVSTGEGIHQRYSKAEYFANVLNFFLEFGSLPWWANASQINLQTMQAEVSNNIEPLVSFLQLKIEDAKIWQRVVYQFNDNIQQSIISSIEVLHQISHYLLQFLQQFEEQLIKKGYNVNRVANFWSVANSLILTHATYFFRASPLQAEYLIKDIIQQNADLLFHTSSQIDFQQVFSNADDYYTGENSFVEEDTSELSLSEKSIHQKFTVHDAGIILLTPFLNSFFNNRNLLKGNEWKDKSSQYKAIHLLKFISTGKWESPEYNLVLEKIFCGLNIHEPVPLCIDCTDEDIAEAESLMNAVVEHWKTLKNTSVAGLRNTFLQRDAILTQRERDWYLQVEKKSWDVLLESIPWGFSTCALPWNNYIIYTEW